MTEPFQHFFKPEVQSAGEVLVSMKAVYLKIGTDTQIDASIKVSTPVQVAFRSASIESAEFSVDCSCKAAAKGQMCKHIWATLLVATEKQPDFFSEKTSLRKGDVFSERSAKKAASTSPEATQRQLDYQQRQAEARKQAYQSQKARLKEMKATRSGGGASGSSKSTQFLPEPVQEALQYFEVNGFPMTLPIDDEQLNNAKRILARVFHPDKGGTQEEVLELLRNADILLKHR